MSDFQSSFTTQRPVAVLMIFLASVVFGVFSLFRLPLTLMPELSYPTLTVRTEYAGAAPEEVENDISRPIEEALGVIGGLNKISSISRSGVSDVVLEFVWGMDMGEATQNVLEKLDLVFLPDEANRPLILHFDPSLDPIMELSFSGSGERFEGESGLRRLRRLAELQIKRQLEPIQGIAAVRIRGGLEEEIHVLLDEEKLRRTNISIQNVVNQLGQDNINLAGGTIKEGRAEYMVRTLNEFETIQEIGESMVAKIGERKIRVRDLGEVKLSHKEREIVTHTDGSESVLIEIYKEADTNMVTLAKRVKERIGPLPNEKNLQQNTNREDSGSRQRYRGLAEQLYREEGAVLKVAADRSIFIESSINEVRNTAAWGGLFAVLILFLFLRDAKATFIVGISIPISILITFAPLKLSGVSLNIMSLGGLALGIGMLVDSSIVVLESIFRCKEEGDGVVAAAIRGTNEVRGAVFASTLTSIAVFFPMVFVSGIAGQIFGDLGISVVTSLLASLIVALFLIPMLASRRPVNLDRGKDEKHWYTFNSGHQLAQSLEEHSLFWAPFFIVRFVLAFVLEAFGKLIMALISLLSLLIGLLTLAIRFIFKFLAWLPLKLMGLVLDVSQKIYPPTIRWALRNAALVGVGVVALIAWIVVLVMQMDTELLPEVHQGEFTFEVSLPVGTPLEETEKTLRAVEETILENRQNIDSVLVTYGYDVNNTKRSDEGEHSAKFKVLLHPSPDPQALEEKVMARLRTYFDPLPDVAYRVTRPVLFSAATPIEVEIYGSDLKELRDRAAETSELLRGLPELSDVETTLKRGAPEIQIRYDRESLMRYQLNLDQIARLVRAKIRGDEATKFNYKDRRVPILVQLNEPDRTNVADIGQITVNPGGDHPIPLDAVAELYLDEGPSEVRRIDGSRVAVVSANLGNASLGTAVRRIEEVLETDLSWQGGLTYAITGQNEEWERSKGSLYLALFLSLFLVYVIMASQFESLMYPFVIMFTVPLAFLGTLLGLQALNISLSVVVFLGMIMLAGIVVNNAIVLVDYINTLKRRGLEMTEAIVTAGQVRLRPILMTTATTVLGLLPMAIGAGDGAEIRTPMAIAVICGLISSTLLTLLVIPAVYYIFDLTKARLFGEKTATESTFQSSEEVTA